MSAKRVLHDGIRLSKCVLNGLDWFSLSSFSLFKFGLCYRRRNITCMVPYRGKKKSQIEGTKCLGLGQNHLFTAESINVLLCVKKTRPNYLWPVRAWPFIYVALALALRHWHQHLPTFICPNLQNKQRLSLSCCCLKFDCRFGPILGSDWPASACFSGGSPRFLSHPSSFISTESSARSLGKEGGGILLRRLDSSSTIQRREKVRFCPIKHKIEGERWW